MASTHAGKWREPSALMRDGGGAALLEDISLADTSRSTLVSITALARTTVSYPRGLLLSTAAEDEDDGGDEQEDGENGVVEAMREGDEAPAAAASPAVGAGGFRADLLCWKPVGILSWANSFM